MARGSRIALIRGTNSIRQGLGMKTSFWNGFSSFVAQEIRLPAYSCASGNCSWAHFNSLVCSTCLDLSGLVQTVSGRTKVSLITIPGGWVGSTPPGISNNDVMASNVDPGEYSFTKHKIPELCLSMSNYNGRARCTIEGDPCPDTYLSTSVTVNRGRTIFFNTFAPCWLRCSTWKRMRVGRRTRPARRRRPLWPENALFTFCVKAIIVSCWDCQELSNSVRLWRAVRCKATG